MTLAERHGEWAMIAGASDGTGRAFARRLAAAVPSLLVGRPSCSRASACPGPLGEIIAGVGFEARIVMGGDSMAPEQFYVFAAQNERLTIHFAAGEEQKDMKFALRSIADGRVDVGAWLVPPNGRSAVAAASVGMSGPDARVRHVVDPRFA